MNVDKYTLLELQDMLKLVNKLKTENKELNNRLDSLKTNPYRIIYEF